MRAMKIAFLELDYMYISALNECSIPTLEVYRVSLCQNVLWRMQDYNKFNTILPPPRTNVRNTHIKPLPKTYTNRYFAIINALYNLQ